MSSKKGFLIAELILVGLTAFFLILLIRGNTEPEKKQVTVILEDSENEKWTALKGGLKAGASDAGIRLSFLSTGVFESVSDESSAVKEALQEGADGLIVWPLNKEAETTIKKAVHRTPLIFIGNGHTDGVRTVKTSPEAAGRRLAKAILEDYSSDLSEKHLGILISNPKDQTEKEMRKGLKRELMGSGVTFSWELGSAGDEEVTKKISEFRNRTEIIVALDDRQIDLTTEMKKDGNLNRAVLYGAGRSMNSVYQLDAGNLQALIIPDDFDMGYRAARKISSFSRFFKTAGDNSRITIRLLHQKDLMKKENQDILYMISHNL
jgi:ribose transport system substrate-binding protein